MARLAGDWLGLVAAGALLVGAAALRPHLPANAAPPPGPAAAPATPTGTPTPIATAGLPPPRPPITPGAMPPTIDPARLPTFPTLGGRGFPALDHSRGTGTPTPPPTPRPVTLTLSPASGPCDGSFTVAGSALDPAVRRVAVGISRFNTDGGPYLLLGETDVDGTGSFQAAVTLGLDGCRILQQLLGPPWGTPTATGLQAIRIDVGDITTAPALGLQPSPPAEYVPTTKQAAATTTHSNPVWPYPVLSRY